MYVGRRRPLAAGPVLVDLLVQRQRQRSVSYGQPQHQRLLGDGDGDGDGIVTGSTHVLLGVVKALDRLVEGGGNGMTRTRGQTKVTATAAWRSIYVLLFFSLMDNKLLDA